MKANYKILFFIWTLAFWQLANPVILYGNEESPKRNPMIVFQEALYQEQTEGNLDKAIELYQQVLDQAAEVERLAARTMYQLGMCHLKKGDEQAAAVYFKKLVETYPKQASVVKKAKKQLEKIAPKSDNATNMLPVDIIKHIISKHFATGKKANQLGIPSNTQIYGVENFNIMSGGLIDVFNMGMDTWTDKRFIARFTPGKKDLKLYNELYQEQDFEWHDVDLAQGKRSELFWNPDRPVKPGEFRVLGYVYNKKFNLTQTDDHFELKMQNQYGTEVMENFFLILPSTMKIIDKTHEINSHQRLGQLDIYQFERHMHGEENVVKVTLDFVDLTTPNSPYVVETSPANLTDNLSPDTTEITVTFDKEMFPYGYAWCQSMQPYPDMAGSPYFSNGNFSCTLPVKLKAGQYYRIGINSPPYQSFRGVDESPAHHYVLVFATADENGKPTRIPPSLIEEAKLINNLKTDTTSIFTDSFEQGDTNPTGWQTGANVDGVKYLWDRKTGSDGTSSLCLKKNAQKYFPIAQWTRTIEHTGDAKQLSVSAQVRAKKAYKAVIDALFLDDKGDWIKHEWVSYIGAKEAGDGPANHNWTPYAGVVDIPENTKKIVIGLQMYGPGAVWFDELEVKYLGKASQIGSQNSPQQTVEAFLKAVLSDNVQDHKVATSYILAGKGIIDDIDEFPTILNGQKLTVESAYGDDLHALIITSPIHADHGRSGALVFTLEKLRNAWFISDIDIETVESMKDELSRFRKIYPSVKKIENFAPEKVTIISKPGPLKAEDLTAEGWKLWGQRKLAEAEIKFKEAIQIDPDNENAYQGLGWAQFNQGKKKNAELSFKKCIKLNPQNAAALNGLGWIAHGNNDKLRAIGWWEKAVKAQPGATAALSGLTKTYMEIEEYDKAIKYYQMWLKAEPNNQEAKDGLRKAQQKKPLVSIDDIAPLIKELDNPDAPRFAALNKLIDLGSPAVEPLINRMKTSNNWQVPKALGAIGDQRATGPLIEKWKSSNTSPMKEVIAESLEKITQKDFGQDLKAWQNWWQQAKDTYTPQSTIQNFMQAALAFNTNEAMGYVAPESHDYDDIKEIFEDNQHPFNKIFKLVDPSIPVKITKADINGNMCIVAWQVTLKEDFNMEGRTMKAGTTLDLDGNLHQYGDKWLITGI